MALVLTGNLRHQSIYAETLFNSTRRLWLPSRHPLCEKSQVTLADVAGEPFIMLTVDEAADSAMRYWEEAGFRPDVILRTSSVEAVRSMVANGSGIAILSDLGLSSVVAGRKTHRDPFAGQQCPSDERRSGVAQ